MSEPATVPTVTVRVFFPARPEHFAYLIPEHGRFYAGRDADRGRVVTLEGIPTWSYAEKWAHYRAAGARLVHDDEAKTPWTDEDWDRRHIDTHAVNERLKQYGGRRLSFI